MFLRCIRDEIICLLIDFIGCFGGSMVEIILRKLLKNIGVLLLFVLIICLMLYKEWEVYEIIFILVFLVKWVIIVFRCFLNGLFLVLKVNLLICKFCSSLGIIWFGYFCITSNWDSRFFKLLFRFFKYLIKKFYRFVEIFLLGMKGGRMYIVRKLLFFFIVLYNVGLLWSRRFFRN